jgi:hypothetical protein
VLDSLGVIGFGTIGFLWATFFVWNAKNPRLLIRAARFTPWAFLTRGRPLTEAESEEQFHASVRPIWLFILFGRAFQVISAGLIALGLLWLVAAGLGLAPGAGD